MYAIIRIAKHSTNGSLGAMSKHNKREMKVPNANLELTKFNQEVVGTGDYIKDVNDAIARSNVHTQKNSVKAIEHIMTATPEFFNKYSAEEMKIENKDERNTAYHSRRNDWVNANVEFLREHYGPYSIVASVSLHLDESTPHLHAFVVPITKGKLKGGKEIKRLGAKSFTGDTKGSGGRQKLQKMQDNYAEKMARFGLERGIKYSNAQHVTMKKLHTNMSRAEEYVKNKKYEIPMIDELPPPIVGREKWVEKQNEVIKEKMTSFVDDMKQQVERTAFLKASELLALSKKKRTEDLESKERAQLLDKTIKAVESHKNTAAGFEMKNNKLSEELETIKEDKERWKMNYEEAKADINNLLKGTITPERLEVLKSKINTPERTQKRDNGMSR